MAEKKPNMIKARFKVSIAAADWSYRPGQVAEIEEKFAVSFFKSGIAEPVAESPEERETADEKHEHSETRAAAKNTKKTNNKKSKQSKSKETAK